MPKAECILCRGAEADTELERIEVWQDSHWRLTVSLSPEVAGFARSFRRYLATCSHEPQRSKDPVSGIGLWPVDVASPSEARQMLGPEAATGWRFNRSRQF